MNLISIKQAASLLGVSIQTLRLWDASGALSPAYRTAGKHRRYSTDQISQFKRRNGSHPSESDATLGAKI